MPTWTQAEIDRLKAKIASAVESVAYGDRSMRNAELDKMMSLLDRMESDNAGAGATTSDGRATIAGFSRD